MALTTTRRSVQLGSSELKAIPSRVVHGAIISVVINDNARAVTGLACATCPPSCAEGVLLDPAADFVDDLGTELHDMERIQHRDGVGQFVADSVGVATERVQRSVLDAGYEPGMILGPEPAGVNGARPAGDDAEQPSGQAPVLVAGQVHHRRDSPIGICDVGERSEDGAVLLPGTDEGCLRLCRVSVIDVAGRLLH